MLWIHTTGSIFLRAREVPNPPPPSLDPFITFLLCVLVLRVRNHRYSSYRSAVLNHFDLESDPLIRLLLCKLNLPEDLSEQVASFSSKPRYKLCEWVLGLGISIDPPEAEKQGER